MSVYRIDRNEEAVREVQRYLRAVSYRHKEVPHIGIDGIFGEETREALRAFQPAVDGCAIKNNGFFAFCVKAAK